jgi:hypothetical protein
MAVETATNMWRAETFGIEKHNLFHARVFKRA